MESFSRPLRTTAQHRTGHSLRVGISHKKAQKLIRKRGNLLLSLRSAKGAKYESQGQALSAAKRVAPWLEESLKRALKVRNKLAGYSALSELHGYFVPWSRGDVLASLRTCPWLLYFAPLALSD